MDESLVQNGINFSWSISCTVIMNEAEVSQWMPITRGGRPQTSLPSPHGAWGWWDWVRSSDERGWKERLRWDAREKFEGRVKWRKILEERWGELKISGKSFQVRWGGVRNSCKEKRGGGNFRTVTCKDDVPEQVSTQAGSKLWHVICRAADILCDDRILYHAEQEMWENVFNREQRLDANFDSQMGTYVRQEVCIESQIAKWDAWLSNSLWIFSNAKPTLTLSTLGMRLWTWTFQYVRTPPPTSHHLNWVCSYLTWILEYV